MTGNPKLEIVSADALDRLVEQARSERWSELVLLGPRFELAADARQWPKELTSARRVFQLRESVPDLAGRLAGLTHLTALELRDNGIGTAFRQLQQAALNM